MLAATLAVARKISPIARSTDTKLSAVISGILLYNIAAERAAKNAQGPGSWKVAFLDHLASLVDSGFTYEDARIEKLALL